MKVAWTRRAREHVLETIKLIRWDKPGAASNWADRIFAEVETLADFPRRGRVVPEVERPNLRELLVGNYRVIYRIDEDVIVILAVRHGRRLLDLDELQ
jgi:plasmid stabilization system protein ParE